MKKFAVMFLALIFALLPLTVYAQDEAPAETKIMMGDVTNDRKISAADARSVLRMGANLDSKDGVSMLAADVDANGRITAADARIILRASAKLEPIACGFDADGNLNAVNVIKSRAYTMEIAIVDSGSEFPMHIVFNGDDFCLKIDTLGDEDGADDISDMRLLLMDGKTYALATMGDLNIGATEDFIAQIFGDEMLGDFSELINMANFVDSMISDDIGVPQKITENGEDRFVYNYEALEQTVTLKTDSYGRIETISSDDGFLNIVVKSVSGEVALDMFNIDNYLLF